MWSLFFGTSAKTDAGVCFANEALFWGNKIFSKTLVVNSSLPVAASILFVDLFSIPALNGAFFLLYLSVTKPFSAQHDERE
jgi:hypothetical protein